MSEKEYVILVDEKDNQIGLMEKEEAHVKAVLHRAFSVFIFNDKMSCCFNKERLENIILLDFGPTPVAVTHVSMKP